LRVEELAARVDRNGNRTSYGYTDANGDGKAEELSQSTDPFGRTAAYAYTNGLLTSMTDYAGRTTTYQYNASRRLTTMTQVDPDGAGPLTPSVTQFGYDSQGLMTSTTDATGLVTNVTYDFALRVSSMTRAGRGTEYFSPAEIQGLVDPNSGQGTLQNPAPLARPSDAVGTYTDPYNQTTTYRMDRFGYVTEVVDALGNKTTFERDANGFATRMTLPDPDGPGPLTSPVYTYTLDAKGNVTGMTLPDGRTRAWTYDGTFSQLLSYRNEDNRTWTYTIDAKGNRTKETAPLSRVTDYTYNARGQVTSVKQPDPDGNGPLTRPVTNFAYDTLGRMTQITLHDAAVRVRRAG
jgi:YD repeat-containing protein